jgi:hypothetical protein
VIADEGAQGGNVSHHGGSRCVDACFAKPGPHRLLVVYQLDDAR